MGKQQSSLPVQKFSWKRFFSGNRGAPDPAVPRVTWRSLIILGVFVGLVALGLVISNEYIRHHRKLYLVNAFAQPARIEIQGRGPAIAVRHVADIELPEGHYHASISGPVKDEMDFDIRSSYFSRWGDDPIWLINVGGAAVLMQENVTYAEVRPRRPFRSITANRSSLSKGLPTHSLACLTACP